MRTLARLLYHPTLGSPKHIAFLKKSSHSVEKRNMSILNAAGLSSTLILVNLLPKSAGLIRSNSEMRLDKSLMGLVTQVLLDFSTANLTIRSNHPLLHNPLSASNSYHISLLSSKECGPYFPM